MPKTWTSVDVLWKTHKNVDDVKDAEGKDGRRIHGRRIKALVDAEDAEVLIEFSQFVCFTDGRTRQCKTVDGCGRYW